MQNNDDKLVNIKSLLIRDSEILHALTCHTNKIEKLQKVIRSHLSEPLSQNLFVGNYNSEVIILHATSSAWASRLRYNIPDLLKIAQTHCDLPELQSIRIKVVPEQHYKSPQKRELKLSGKSKELIQNIAETVDSEDLKAALLRLAKP